MHMYIRYLTKRAVIVVIVCGDSIAILVIPL
jgi:hypothetical protein